MGRLAAVMVILIMNLAGCSNSGNPDAPTSKAPHEKTWVNSHPAGIYSANNDAVVRDEAGQPVNTGKLIAEQIFQCRVCHGQSLGGAKADAAGPDCLDCHVLDPLEYPVMCFSCHGYPAMTTQKWYSSNRAIRPGLPMNSGFSKRVENDENIHITQKKHGKTGDVSAKLCAVCHGGKEKTGVKHHEIAMGSLQVGCVGPLPFGCHVFNFDQPIGEPTFSVPNCSINTPQLVCHSSGNNPL